MGRACDAPLICNGSQTDPSARCLPSVAAGGSCDIGYRASNACAEGSSCHFAGINGSYSTCTVDGILGERCRGGGVPCDGSLVCNGGRCVAPTAIGGACDGADPSNTPCPLGSTCVGNFGGMICVGDGALRARCRATGAACDLGLACADTLIGGDTRCRPSAGVGEVCDAWEDRNACVAGATCTGSGATSTCKLDGSKHGLCRATGTACDPHFWCFPHPPRVGPTNR